MPLITSEYADNETLVYSFFTVNMKYNLAIVCAILANIDKESGFNPKDEYTESGGYISYGLCQWNNGGKTTGRLYNLKVFSRTNSLGYYTAATQVKFIKYELETSESSTKKYLDSHNTTAYNNAAGAQEIAGEFFSRYERGAAKYRPERIARALDFWNYYTNASPSSSSINTEAFNSSVTYPEEELDYQSLSYYDPYSAIIEKNLSSVKTPETNHYGYLFDLTHGGEFKFYIPEFTEQAGANWSDIDIPGRSVKLVSYESTNSRSITVTLDLYAGVELYNVKNPVTTLHKDAKFLKSLEYPDYSNPIARPPASVQLILGSTINMQGIVKDVSIEHRKPLDSKGRSMYLHVSFTVVQIAVNPPDYSDIRNGNYYLTTPSSPGDN